MAGLAPEGHGPHVSGMPTGPAGMGALHGLGIVLLACGAPDRQNGWRQSEGDRQSEDDLAFMLDCERPAGPKVRPARSFSERHYHWLRKI
jgi:hypothetical protein